MAPASGPDTTTAAAIAAGVKVDAENVGVLWPLVVGGFVSGGPLVVTAASHAARTNVTCPVGSGRGRGTAGEGLQHKRRTSAT
jgi:hypothetical protein